LPVAEFDDALAFYRDELGLQQIADWSSDAGRVVLLEAGRATLELLDDAQAATVDRIEAAGERVSGTVRLALEVSREALDRRPQVFHGWLLDLGQSMGHSAHARWS